MTAPKKLLKNFPLAKPTAQDLAEHRGFLDWFRLHHQPRYTASLWIPRISQSGYVLTANNRAKVGFSNGGIAEMVYLHPQSHSWFAINLTGSHHTKQWREGSIPDENFRFHRRYCFNLKYRLAYWKEQIPGLIDYLGCASDIRLIASLTVILEYNEGKNLKFSKKKNG